MKRVTYESKLSERNPDVFLTGEYLGGETYTSFKGVCGHEWSDKPSRQLLKGGECPICADVRRHSNPAVYRDGYVEVSLATKKHPDAILLLDTEDWEKLKGKGGRISPIQPRNVVYAVMKVGASATRIHQMVLNVPDGKEIDHINHNGLDNRKSNLRICDRTENNCNARSVKGSSGIKGVRKGALRKNGEYSWNAALKHRGVLTTLTFKTKEEAIVGRLGMEDAIHGEYKHNEDSSIFGDSDIQALACKPKDIWTKEDKAYIKGLTKGALALNS